METTTAIVGRGLTKRYDEVLAVAGISFMVRKGECFGFLGPNGAGKTTTMKMIACLSPVTDGDLQVDGKSVKHEQRIIKSSLGILSQDDSLDPDLSVVQNLVAYGRFFNIPRKILNDRVWETLDMFQLCTKAHQKPEELSGGMRRRLLIARALLNQPKILVLDEPTTGLDPQSRHLVWEKLIFLKSQGITILLTTHYMDEAAYLCDRLVVMDLGHILVEGTPAQLICEHTGEWVVEIRARQDQKPQLFDTLTGQGLQFMDTGVSVVVYGDTDALLKTGVGLNDCQMARRLANLEDVFLRLTGRGLREE